MNAQLPYRNRRKRIGRKLVKLAAAAIACAGMTANTWAASINEEFSNVLASNLMNFEMDDYSSLDLDALMNISVTSVAGVENEWFKTPAAMYVITNEDVRRSGHRSLAESLRLSPGLQIGQINSNIWKVGARGFAHRFSGNLLVLIDGRTVYSPVFSGVWWDVQDVLMEDLDRIEVIRGPGATLWGANAVNGVVNVTTRSAKDSQGLYVTGGGGNIERGFGAVRYGGQIGDNAWFRVYTKYDNREAFNDMEGHKLHDDWDKTQGGFRFDMEGNDGYSFTAQGDMYYSDNVGNEYRMPVPNFLPTYANFINNDIISGGNVLFRVRKDNDDGSGWALQGYYDRTNRDLLDRVKLENDTFDIDFRHHFSLGDRHELIWGVGYRHVRGRTEPNQWIMFDPQDRSFDTFSAFIQDTITLVDDKLFLMLGTKIEENDTTGFEIQPSARLWWTPNDDHTVWGAVSRPVRTPSRLEQNVAFNAAYIDSGLLMGGAPSGVNVPLQILGNPDEESEEALVFELGHRMRVTDDLTVDTAGFYNSYRKINDFPGIGFGTFENASSAESYGVEVAATWRVASNWRLEGSYSFNRVLVHALSPIYGPGAEASSPEHQFQVRSYLDITEDLELNTALYYVDHVRAVGAGSYFRLDLGMTWRPTENLELALWGQNLLEGSHREASDPMLQARPQEVPRGVYGQVTVRF